MILNYIRFDLGTSCCMAAAATADAPRYVKPGIAEQVLGVDRRTIQKWADEGLIKSLRPGGKGQRLYDVSSVGVSAPAVEPSKASVDVIYARVSTRKQLPDLQTQIKELQDKYPDHVVFSDCASGLNFKRRGLASLLQLAFEKRLRLVCVAHKDRLCRFAYDLIEHIFKVHGAKICVESDDVHSAEQELTEDVISVITVFGARLYGSRSGRGHKKKATDGGGSGGSQPSSIDGGADEAEDAVQASGSAGGMHSNLQGEDAADVETGAGAEEMLQRVQKGVQLGKRTREGGCP